jgi:hypothetical protein
VRTAVSLSHSLFLSFSLSLSFSFYALYKTLAFLYLSFYIVYRSGSSAAFASRGRGKKEAIKILAKKTIVAVAL